MKPEVIIRVDGSPQIGLGHLVRCFALAQMLKDDFEINFMCRDIPDNIRSELGGNGFSCSIIKSEDEFLGHLTHDTIAVLDGYPFYTHYQKNIKSTGAKLVCIDDLHDKVFFADLIINHAPGIIPQDYTAQPCTEYALGLDYSLLRPSFLDQAKKERIIEKMDTLMICFGGSNHKNLVESTLLASLEFPQFKKIILVTGAAYELGTDFNIPAGSNKKIEHRQALNEKQMLDTMLEADVVIVPASGILLEALASGCVVISGTYVENQKFLYEHSCKAGLVIDAGNFDSEKVKHAIGEALNGPKNILKSIDGQTASRILKLFHQLHQESFISLRQAVSADLELTFSWAVNPEIRRYSFQQHQITKEEHTHWFLNKITDPCCHYLLMEYNSKPVGSIRFDMQKGEAAISYLLDPTSHGQGLGQILLKKGIGNLLEVNYPESTPVTVITGQVMKSNLPSIKSFERLGFTKTDQGVHFKFEKFI